MSIHWLWLAWLYPLMGGLWLVRLGPAALTGPWPGLLLRTASLPALIAVATVPTDVPLDVPWLLLGARFELGALTRIFLLFTALLWGVAGWYGARYVAHDERRHRFALCWLLSLSGNLGLIVAGDIPGFYTFFALMTFAAYGLVVHSRSDTAIRAGRVYIAMAILGEVMILSGLLLIALTGESLLIRDAVAGVSGSGWDHAIIPLILFGFGVKTGLLPLHGWLALAHPVAPTPASAVLSGSMIKAGLLGWISFLPGGYASYAGWGSLIIALGCLGAFYAVAVGLTQQNPKTNLAYSSISQMGVMTICIGIGLSEVADWSTAVLIVAIYALNHAFAKGALFLGVGVVLAEPRTPRIHRYIIFAGLGLAALAIAGSPMTGGALAKRALKYLAASEHLLWAETLNVLLPLSALATTLLLSRLLYLLYRKMTAADRQPDGHEGLMFSWSVNLLAVAVMAWLTIYSLQLPISTSPFTPADLLKAALPILGGLFLAYGAWHFMRPLQRVPPAGDIVVAFERVAQWIAGAWVRIVAHPLEQWDVSADPFVRRLLPTDRGRDRVLDAETRIRRFEVSGAVFVFLMVMLLFALWMG